MTKKKQNNKKSVAKPKGSGRRDLLRKIEKEVQKSWNEKKIFEQDAPLDGKKEKYLITFPYPYMNGRLHLGHAFSLTKTEFTARFQKLLGKNVLFPFAFHCTGMPIAAASEKIKRELKDYGNPPIFPVEKEEKPKEEKVFKDKTKYKGKKSKSVAKGAIAKKKKVWQYNIMKSMNVPNIEKFSDPNHWLEYFPPLAKQDLMRFGCAIDFRRSFITTPINPFYDSFIKWQFEKLKELKLISFQKRYSIFSTIENQPCADHDRSEGEGAGPQEYTLIKILVQRPYPKPLASLQDKQDLKIYFVPATLRPETMYGQTNCWVLPSGVYGAFKINKTEAFICTKRSARNLAFQGHSEIHGKVNCLVDNISGKDLIGTALSSPNALYKTIYALPMMSISTAKTTGVVSSVPSDSPDDYAALQDLIKKPNLRKKFGVKDEWVLPFKVVPIINIPGYGDQSAKKVYEEMKIKSQNDKVKLLKAKELVYNKGFYEGKLIVGPHKGKKIQFIKDVIKKELYEANQGINYAEPEKLVISRSGDVCVVALTDQWYLKYGQEDWRKKVEEHVKGTLETYSPGTKKALLGTVAWLKEWACSREFGLGTRLPWDKKFVIESLSDSTIYMAYYTVAHILQGGVLDGSNKGKIKASQMTKEVWDIIMLKESPTNEEVEKVSKSSGIEVDLLKTMNREFNYWYPVDLRSSGKDLIQNHLTMFLYNHAAIFPKKKWPQSIFANGHIGVDGEKMSKSKGNFLMLESTFEKYSCDATRISLADAGDGLEDANFERKTADFSILRLTTFITWATEQMANLKLFRTGGYNFADKVFDNKINLYCSIAKENYTKMNFREALRESWYDFQKAKEDYRIDVDSAGFHRELILKFIENQCLIMSPITPHVMEHIWTKILKKNTSITNALWPKAEPVDTIIIRSNDYFHGVVHSLRQKLSKDKKRSKKKVFTTAYIYCVDGYAPNQLKAIKIVRSFITNENREFPQTKQIIVELKKVIKNKREMNMLMGFIQILGADYSRFGLSALSETLPVDEHKILSSKKKFISETLGLENIIIFKTSDKDIIDKSNRAKNSASGKPSAVFE